MKLEEIMKLIDAGYTKEEINEFKDLQKTEEPEPAKEPAKEPKQDDKTDPEPEPEPHYPDEISKLTEQVKALTESMQEHFRSEAEEKKTDALDGEQVLKDIIEKGVI